MLRIGLVSWHCFYMQREWKEHALAQTLNSRMRNIERGREYNNIWMHDDSVSLYRLFLTRRMSACSARVRNAMGRSISNEITHIKIFNKSVRFPAELFFPHFHSPTFFVLSRCVAFFFIAVVIIVTWVEIIWHLLRFAAGKIPEIKSFY